MSEATATKDRERRRIIRNARRTLGEIEQIFIDCDYWNDNVRKPGEEPIDCDPDGALRRMVEGLTRMLAEDTGEGPIPPIGGWLSPVFGRGVSQEPQ